MLHLKPLYQHNLRYPKGWSVSVQGVAGSQAQHLYLAEGTCHGRITGTLHGVNHPSQRTDLTMRTNFQAMIETQDGAVIYCDVRGYGREHPSGRRHIVLTATHLTDDDRYKWLNDVLCIGVGTARMPNEGAVVSSTIQETSTAPVKPSVEYTVNWWEIEWDPSGSETVTFPSVGVDPWNK